MKKQIITIVIFLFLFPVIFYLFPVLECGSGLINAQGVSINPTGTPANASSILDVNSSNKGILIPRVGLTSTSDIVTIPSPATSLLVYNTATAGTAPNNVIPGFYYWSGMKWSPVTSPTGAGGTLAFAEFYALMPPDNSATVGAGTAVEFPNTGPTTGTDIQAVTATLFRLLTIGTYMVQWQVSTNEPGQLVLNINGSELPYTIVGRATGTSQITGCSLITTVVPNTILSVNNPIGNSPALTITPFAGGSHPVSATLVITRLQ